MINTEASKKVTNKPECYTVLTTGRILHITLKKQWFDLISKGIKTEEYREIKPYWYARFFKDTNPKTAMRIECCDNLLNDKSAAKWNLENGYYHKFREYDSIVFKNGYAKNAPTLIVEFDGINIGKGYAPWGAIGNQVYFVIKLGKILFDSTKLAL